MEYKGVEYKADWSILTDTVVSVLAEGKFPTDDPERWSKYCEDTYGGDRVLAVIEFPTIDIELEAYTDDGGEPNEACDEDNKIWLGYVVCRKIKSKHFADGVWETDGAGECHVDFSLPNWGQLLEEDMLKTLDAHATKYGYSYTELHEF